MFFKADLIILDEPTTALSLTQSREVLQFVERARQEGSTVLFISHNIFHSHQVADRIVIVDRGRIAAQMDKEGISAIELAELMPAQVPLAGAGNRGLEEQVGPAGPSGLGGHGADLQPRMQR